jgi:hypothetical protein
VFVNLSTYSCDSVSSHQPLPTHLLFGFFSSIPYGHFLYLFFTYSTLFPCSRSEIHSRRHWDCFLTIPADMDSHKRSIRPDESKTSPSLTVSKANGCNSQSITFRDYTPPIAESPFSRRSSNNSESTVVITLRGRSSSNEPKPDLTRRLIRQGLE